MMIYGLLFYVYHYVLVISQKPDKRTLGSCTPWVGNLFEAEATFVPIRQRRGRTAP